MKHRRLKFHKDGSKYKMHEENIYIELDTKCNCPSPIGSDQASIQFARRYLECPGSMPVRILRRYIEQVLPHSPMTQVSIFDSNDRLLKDSDRLNSLNIIGTSSSPMSLRFTLLNTVTSVGHCLCSSPSSPVAHRSLSSSFPTIIRRETMKTTLSTCPFVTTPPQSPSSSPVLAQASMPIVNLLTPPSPCRFTSFLIDNIVESNHPDETIVNQITSEFGEICPTMFKSKRSRLLKKIACKSSVDLPLDLTLKKRPSFEFASSQAKWLKMI